MLPNAYLLAKIGADTAENERNFAENWQLDEEHGELHPSLRSIARDASAALSARPIREIHPHPRDRSRAARSEKFRQNAARFRLYRRRSLQVNTRFAEFFKLYQIIYLNFLKVGKILQILRHLQRLKKFAEFSQKLLIFQTDFLRTF